VASKRTLLAVHAHPDDETITTGGTLARYSAEGVRTVVVTCTQGELGWVFEPTLVGQDVGALRERELADACSALGVSRLARLGYADSGMPGVPENERPGAFFAADVHEAADRLVKVLDEERPLVMLTYDETGGYGHPDHVKAHQVAVAAFEAAGAARPEKLYFVRFPMTWSREFVRELREAGIDAPGSAPAGADAGPDLDEIGVADDLVTTAIDVRPYLPSKLAALACHRSQLPPDHFLRRMPLELAKRLWAYEYFSREVGPIGHSAGLETDLFAGLD
jgi:N-acetyl-1-D-myo-inositol-2-amino-2-deoxy-alpha-D-glucopyranoside deacetylase